MASRYWRRPLDQAPPTGALGRVHVIAERCKGCALCFEFCPRQVLAESAGYNQRGYHPPEVTKADRCVDCRLCELLCPEFAIYVTAIEVEQEEASHR